MNRNDARMMEMIGFVTRTYVRDRTSFVYGTGVFAGVVQWPWGATMILMITDNDPDDHQGRSSTTIIVRASSWPVWYCVRAVPGFSVQTGIPIYIIHIHITYTYT